MSTRIAINGFGRIGRLCLRALMLKEPQDLEIVAVNDLGAPDLQAHLFKYDSIHGTAIGSIEQKEAQLNVNGHCIRLLSERDPELLPWKDLNVDLVIEATGRFTERTAAQKHLKAGAKKVIISAPGKNEDITIVMGVNQECYDPKQHQIISNASCTTNCLAPVAKVLLDEFGIDYGMMTTVHSVTNDQQILDLAHKDWRRARAAYQSMIPTTTGAAKAVSLVLPGLKDRLNGMAVRVPTPNVSLVDFVANLSSPATKEEVNSKLRAATEGKLKGIMEYTELPLVSCDFNGNQASSIIDGLSTIMLGDRMVKVVAWYDNEWGYANRIIDLAGYIGSMEM